MKHTSKRLQALVLVLAMCVSFLQIPSFATDNGHHGEVIARRATFASDGSFTVTKSCDAHPNASEETVSGKIIEKKQMKLPERVTNVVKCKNPRCITSVEQELDQVFCLTNPEKAQYRCLYCEQEYARK